MVDWVKRLLTCVVVVPVLVYMILHRWSSLILASFCCFFGIKEWNVLNKHVRKHLARMMDPNGHFRLNILQQRVDSFDTQQSILQIALFVTSFINSPKSLLCGTICASFFLVVCFLKMVKPFPKLANKDEGLKSPENRKSIKTAQSDYGRTSLFLLLTLSLGLFGLIYCPLLVGHMVLLQGMRMGPGLLLFSFWASFQFDTGALIAGSMWPWPRHHPVPVLSPKKTFEGYVGGFIFSALSVWLYVKLCIPLFPSVFPSASLSVYMLLDVVIAVVSIVGDLLESLIKRAAQQKNSGDFFPGHGGMLDRLDALMLAGTATYYCAWVLGEFGSDV